MICYIEEKNTIEFCTQLKTKIEKNETINKLDGKQNIYK